MLWHMVIFVSFIMLYKIRFFAVFIYGNLTMISIRISDFKGAIAFIFACGHSYFGGKSTSIFRTPVTIL